MSRIKSFWRSLKSRQNRHQEKYKMRKTLRVVAVSGGLQRPSSTLVLVNALIEKLGNQFPLEVHLIELGQIAEKLGGAKYRANLPFEIERDLQAIEQAELLIVATPVYRGSYTGIFKHLFDFIAQEALTDTPVLLAATGGSERHALVIDHQLRPLFSFFQALTLPIGVYASSADFKDYEISSSALEQRIALAIERALPWLNPALKTQPRLAIA
jgi:FMN reductase